MLILVRHAATLANHAGIAIGVKEDPPLSDVGAKQAARLAAWLSSHTRPQQIFTSQMVRARATANAISLRVGIAVTADPALAERDLGPFGGLSRDELLHCREQRGLSVFDPTQDWRGCEGVESDAAIWERFCGFAAKYDLASTWAERDVVVVSHAGVLKAVVHTMLAIEPGRGRVFKFREASAVLVLPHEHGGEMHGLWQNGAMIA